MQFRAEEYFRAGTERMRQARLIHSAGESYALAMYCAGLAVECILRAFRWEKDQSFEGRHDLDNLLRTSRLLDIHEELMRKRGVPETDIVEYSLRLRAAMNEVVTLCTIIYGSRPKRASRPFCFGLIGCGASKETRSRRTARIS
jgi:HEPN domain-containing protein